LPLAPDYYTIWHFERALYGFLDSKRGNAFFVGIAEVFTDEHFIVQVAVLQHALGNGRWRVFAVSKDANLVRMLDKGTIELWPRTTGERNDVHVVVRHDEAVRQHLQGVECGINLDIGFGELAAERVGKAEEKRVARGEYYNGRERMNKGQ